MSFSSRNKVKAEAGMSSMTDLVFLLLIFFIILSTQTADPSLTVDLPSTKSKAPNSKNTTVLEVAVNADDQYFMAGKNPVYYATIDELVPVLDEKMNNQEEKKIKISGDKAANYEAVFKLIALAKNREWKPVLSYKD